MHEHTLLKDVKSLDKLYEKTLDFYDELALYIAAGEAKLKELDETTIPAKEAEVKAAPEDQGVMKAQELRDIRAARDDLERRVHDLRLTRQVTMQSLPSIRLVQENDKSLITKINSTLVNTVPLWETQLAQAVTIHRGREAAGVVKEASDLTNELLRKNAENLRTANAEIRAEMERGVFDIEAIEKANDDLIATIEDSLRIADEGKAKRAAAEQSLVRDGGRAQGRARLRQGARHRHAATTSAAASDEDADDDGCLPCCETGRRRAACSARRSRRWRGCSAAPRRRVPAEPVGQAGIERAAPPAPRAAAGDEVAGRREAARVLRLGRGRPDRQRPDAPRHRARRRALHRRRPRSATSTASRCTTSTSTSAAASCTPRPRRSCAAGTSRCGWR